MTNFDDNQVLSSWKVIAQDWTDAIKNQEIESRLLVTNQAIIEAIQSYSPKSMLDIGCGEGWLTRELINLGIPTSGVDGIPRLIDNAKALVSNIDNNIDNNLDTNLKSNSYYLASYEEIAKGNFIHPTVEGIVCNFSLIGKEAVDNLITSLPSLLKSSGLLFIQTLHPLMVMGTLPYENSWRPGSWDGFNRQFPDAPPWYFRTVESWISLIIKSGFNILEMREPLHPHTQKPASIIFISQRK
jgi:2-polyprenyl-3-methyl-5-hydroxy-6-metoxy-1,4-benzoquinol methylase